MRNTVLMAASVALLLPQLSLAQSAFDGTWKTNLRGIELPEKPNVYWLKDGTYHCNTCVPAVVVKADGRDQKVTGHPYYDTKSVKVLDDRSIEETNKKGGKTVATYKMVVSSDGNDATLEFSDRSASSGAPVTGKAHLLLVARGPVDSHAISGSWLTTKLYTLSDNALTVTLKIASSGLMMTNALGQSYTARLDGTDAPYNGDPGVTTVSLEGIAKNIIEETTKRDGKPVRIRKLTVSADGKTLRVTWHDILHDTTGSFVAKKQGSGASAGSRVGFGHQKRAPNDQTDRP